MLYITTIAFNNELFIELQLKSFQKYLIDDEYTFIVFDDSKEEKYTTAIKQKCDTLGITYIRIDQNIHSDRNLAFKNSDTCARKTMMKYNKNVDRYNICGEDQHSAGYCHCASIQYIFNYFDENSAVHDISILFNIDSDMFLINELHVEDALRDYDMGIVPQGNGGVVYIWPNVFLIDFNKCKHLREMCWDGCTLYDTDGNPSSTDTGGETFQYIEKYYGTHENAKIRKIEDYLITDQQNLESNILKDRVDDKMMEVLRSIHKLYNHQYINKQLLFCYKEKFTIFHLRGYTWTPIYKNTREPINNLLINLLQ